MGLFDAIFKKRKETEQFNGYFKTLTAYKPVFSSWDGAIYESELVRSAIDARARHMSKLKVEVAGAAKPSLQAKLRLAPNAFQTWSQFLYRTSTILDIENTCFIVPVMDKDLTVTGFFTVLPQRCSIVELNGVPFLRYKFRTGDIGAIEMDKCVVLTKFQYKSDFFGDNNHALDNTMGMIDLQKQGTEEAIKNGASYRFMAQLNNFSKPDDLANERKRFSEKNFSAEAEGGGLLLFPNTYTNVQQIKNAPYTIDAEQMEYIRTNVYNYFGVNEKILQNIVTGDEWSSFYEGAIEPFAIQFSETMTRAMFSERERAQGSFLMATANRLQYMSNADKMNFVNNGLDRGMLTVNEAREVWNLIPVEGGDVRTIRGEYKNAVDLDEGQQEENE